MDRLAFVWDNFGFMHNERLKAVADALGTSGEVIGIELFFGNRDYGWKREQPEGFRKLTLFESDGSCEPSSLALAWALIRACLKARATTVFMCGHLRGGIFIAAMVLRLLGRRLIVLTDSKFDDKPRGSLQEWLKGFYYAPYQSALVPSRRSADYLRFLGFRKRPIAMFYYNRPIARIRDAAGAPPAPAGLAHGKRSFLCIARLVFKKNLPVMLEGYARYAAGLAYPRKLVLCGSGPLEDELRALADRLGIAGLVDFRGWQTEQQIARQLAETLALILYSTEEQFGIAVIEALAMGVPAIVSENVGARDLYVRTGVNGFIVEPDNPEGLAFHLQLLDRDERLWSRMAQAAQVRSEDADLALFVRSVLDLAGTGDLAALPTCRPAARQLRGVA